MNQPRTLTVRFVNAHGSRLDMIHAQIRTPVTDRVVQIVLAPEQAAQLQPRKVGTSGNDDVFEEWEVVSLSAGGT